jgi:hypothetical protein
MCDEKTFFKSDDSFCFLKHRMAYFKIIFFSVTSLILAQTTEQHVKDILYRLTFMSQFFGLLHSDVVTLGHESSTQ